MHIKSPLGPFFDKHPDAVPILRELLHMSYNHTFEPAARYRAMDGGRDVLDMLQSSRMLYWRREPAGEGYEWEVQLTEYGRIWAKKYLASLR